MHRVFVVLFLLPFTAFAGDNRFPPVNQKVHSDQNSFQYSFDAGDLHAESRNNGLNINWTSGDGTPDNWDMSPEFYQDQVTCPDEFVQCKNSSFPCYGKCIFSPPIVQLYDSKDKKLYFSLLLDVGNNVPHAVLIADLNNKKASRLFQTDYYSSLGNFVLSPSALSLAYLASWHGSACEGGRTLEVFDLREKNFVKPLVRPTNNSILRKYVVYDSIDWLSNSRLRLKGRSFNCKPGVANKTHIEAIASLPIK